MDDTEVAHWSSPEAAMRHHDAAAMTKKEVFEWEHVAACPGPAPAREITVRWNDSKITVFLISASSPAEMRMLSVYDKPSSSCREIDIRTDMRSIMVEPSE